jgi:hypothetical protein
VHETPFLDMNLVSAFFDWPPNVRLGGVLRQSDYYFLRFAMHRLQNKQRDAFLPEDYDYGGPSFRYGFAERFQEAFDIYCNSIENLPNTLPGIPFASSIPQTKSAIYLRLLFEAKYAGQFKVVCDPMEDSNMNVS